jgi:hypothetical protein
VGLKVSVSAAAASTVALRQPDLTTQGPAGADDALLEQPSALLQQHHPGDLGA